jgi:hypothetical protein
MDFFNLLFASQKLNAYASSYPHASSPVFFIVCNILDKVFPALTVSHYGVRYSLIGRCVFIVYVLLAISTFLTAFTCLLKKFYLPFKYILGLCLVFMSSYPVIFAVDRGNYALLSGALIAFFLLFYLDGKFLLSALFLAFAISLKYYLAVFGVLFIIDKKLVRNNSVELKRKVVRERIKSAEKTEAGRAKLLSLMSKDDKIKKLKELGIQVDKDKDDLTELLRLEWVIAGD